MLLPLKLRRIWSTLGIPLDYASVRGLPLRREAGQLVPIARFPSGRSIRLAPHAAAAWRRMDAAARAAGITLVPISGFRSIARQASLIRAKLRAGEPIGRILRVLAAPGCSEHHSGRALDLGRRGSPDLTTGFGRTREFRWLRRHAGRFGFRLSYPRHNPHGIAYEPWHWCWDHAPSQNIFKKINVDYQRLPNLHATLLE